MAMPDRVRPAVNVRVTDHARERARERFPGFKAARIVDEVRAALCDGRVTAAPEEGLLRVHGKDGRVYVVRAKFDSLLVVTTIGPREMRKSA